MPDHIAHEPVGVGRRAELPPAVADWVVGPFVIEGGLMLDVRLAVRWEQRFANIALCSSDRVNFPLQGNHASISAN
jgi:hypothetical protein